MDTTNSTYCSTNAVLGNETTMWPEEMRPTNINDVEFPASSAPQDNGSESLCYTTHSETSSCNSETLLLASSIKCEQAPKPTENTVYITDEKTGEELQLTYEDITDKVSAYLEKPDQNYLGYSDASMFSDATNVIDDVKVIPLNIIGSGWEFGSITSIHRRHESGGEKCDSMGSRTNSLMFRNEGHAGDRLLHRVFSGQIGDIGTVKKFNDGKDLDVEFVGPSFEEGVIVSTKKRGSNMRNILAASAGLMFLHIAHLGLRNLQSSMNSEGGIGVISMGIISAMFVAGSFVSPFIIRRFGPRRCLVAGTIMHIFYVFANYFVSWYTIIPTSAILGFGSAIMWNAVSTYITELGVYEAETNNKQSNHVIGCYFGLFFLAMQLATVLGNLISSLILVPKPSSRIDILANNTSSITMSTGDNSSTIVYSLPINATEDSLTMATSNYFCGIGFVNGQGAKMEQTVVTDLDKLFLLGTYGTCGVIGVLALVFCLDCLPNFVPRQATMREIASEAASVIAILVDRDFILVAPLCLYSNISVGFVIADILKAYITCPLGMYMVGYTMICYGLCGSVSSFVFGKLLKYIGRVPIFTTALEHKVLVSALTRTPSVSRLQKIPWLAHRKVPIL